MSQPAFDFGDAPGADPTDPTYSVAELAHAINDQLRRGFFDGVWVRGEIDGLRHAGPHTYFKLVEDGDDGRAVLSVSLFAPMKRKLIPVFRRHRLDLANGMKVRIFGHLDFFARSGQLGLQMSGIDPRFTLGELSQARDQVVRRLVSLGLYDANRRHRLTPMPLAVGLVTSVESAAWHDFVHEIERSGFGFRLSVCDTRVQGEGAAASVAAAIATLGRSGVDCIVVIRGGGARNELATFDAEVIAVAIASSPVPVLTGIGHEIDRSVADEVAHSSHKTPTACAVALVEAVGRSRDEAEARWSAVVRAAQRRVAEAGSALSDRGHRISRRTHGAVERADERLGARRDRLVGAATRRLVVAADRLDGLAAGIARRAPAALQRQADQLDQRGSRLALLDPVNLLRRGWSITRAADGTVVRSAAEVAARDLLITQLADGELTSRIEEPDDR